VAERLNLGQETEQRAAPIPRSLPGMGKIVLAKIVLAMLLAEAHQAIQARDYHALRTLTGVAPVTKWSGKSSRVEMRQACAGRLRSAVYHWARRHPAQRPQSQPLRSTPNPWPFSRPHPRTVADGLLGIACAMLTNRTTFDPEKLPADRQKSA
jgi:hypothetical protein